MNSELKKEMTSEVTQKASDCKDEASADLLVSRIKRHEETAWMLKSFLQ